MDDKWRIIHRHSQGVLEGKVPPILCPDCAVIMRAVMDKFGDPALKCDSCKSRFSISNDTWKAIMANLKEAYDY